MSEKTERFALIVGGDPAADEAVARALAADGWRTVIASAFGTGYDGRPSSRMLQTVERVIEEAGHLDLVVWNTVEPPQEGPIDTVTVEVWWSVVHANLDLPFFLAQAAAPHLQRTRGSLIFVTRAVAISGWPEASAFAAASAGIIGLAKSLARELAPHINVNAVAAPTLQRPDHRLPGAASAREHLVRWDRQLSFAERLHDRPVDANDVAATVAFLASPSGAPYTGAVLRPTGGATIS